MRVRPGFSSLPLALAHRPMAAVPRTWSERKREIEQQQQPEASGGVGCRISIASPGASGTLLTLVPPAHTVALWDVCRGQSALLYVVGGPLLSIFGRLAQMVERSLSMREAPGSIPGLSTTFLFLFFCLRLAHSVCRTR